MVNVLINVFTVVLLFVAVFVGFVVLMQRAKSDGGMAAMGGGMAESAFGPDTGNVLSKATINAAIVFFVLSFLLYLGHVQQRARGPVAREALPNIPAALPPAPLPGTTPPATSPQTAPPAAAAPTDAAKPATPDSTTAGKP